MTDDRANPPFRRRQLARMLRQHRERARLTQEVAARKLYISNATVSRIEKAQSAVDVHLLKSALDLYGVPCDRWQSMIELCLESHAKGWWHEYGVTGEGVYIGLETEAGGIRAFALTLIPGLLQTADYTRAVLRTMMAGRRRNQIENQVALRLARQERLTDDAPLHLDAVIDELALLRPVGGEAVMRAQLDYLAGMAELPSVTLRVLPLGAGAHLGMEGAFSILTFPAALEEPDVVYQQLPAGELFGDKPAQLSTFSEIFDRLAGAALDSAESVALLERRAARADTS